MQTDYKKINSFEAAIVGMIVVGFVLIGVLVFTSLTPRQQSHVSSAFDMFDIHEEAIAAADNMQFIMNVPDEFYNQFYIAFTEVATVPVETFELPVQIVSDVSSVVSTALNSFTDHAVQVAYSGQVLGSTIDSSQTQTEGCGEIHEQVETLDFHYEYSSPDLGQIKLTLNKLLN